MKNLEKALRLLICDRLNADADDDTRKALSFDVTGFVRQNAAEYSLEELVETFASYDATIGLFYEFQEAKRLVNQMPVSLRETSLKSGPRKSVDRWQELLTGMVFVWVPGGSFEMGSGDWDDEGWRTSNRFTRSGSTVSGWHKRR